MYVARGKNKLQGKARRFSESARWKYSEAGEQKISVLRNSLTPGWISDATFEFSSEKKMSSSLIDSLQ